jgi:lipoic acid synthetase
MPAYTRRPEWLKLNPINPSALAGIKKLTQRLELNTVCESARCPNCQKCFGEGTATFMILGNVCTRKCTFCAIESGIPEKPDPRETEHILAALDSLHLKYVTITSVTRDDLPDGGASCFADTIQAIHKYNSDIVIEILVPDFNGSIAALKTVIDTKPNVLNHNVETVSRLYEEVRPQASYRRSIKLLQEAKKLKNNLLTKSGFMLGLGETRQEIIKMMDDLRQVDCNILTIGQYLAPSLKHHEVMNYSSPEEFAEYDEIGRKMGFNYVASGPLVRSSFHAASAYQIASG